MLKNIIIITLIVILLISILVIGTITSEISKSKCKSICQEEGALTFEMMAGGGLFTIEKDICICFFRERIKSFKLGDANDEK